MESRRVLIVSYYFPPSGGPGVQRSLKFVKYLPEFGWQPVVLTVDPVYAAYPDLDPDMLNEVPNDVELIRTKSWDPYRLYGRWTGKEAGDRVTVGFLADTPPSVRERAARWVRANLFIPDARVGWVPYALKAAKRRLSEGGISAVFTTGPPHSTHLVGKSLKRHSGLPWLADFRDPWTEIDFIQELPMSLLARKCNERLEQTVLDTSDAITGISPAMSENFQRRTSTRCVTIYNGYDQEDFNGFSPGSPSQSFVIAHTGNMNAARNPESLWRALERVEWKKNMPALKIRLVGNVDGSVLQRLQESSLSEIVEKIDYLPHHEAVKQMQASSILLLSINQVPSARGIVTGKLFEYMAVQRPILGLGPPDGEAARILDETRSGKMYAFDDGAGIESFLKAAYSAWQNQQSVYEPDVRAIERYSRRNQAQGLADLLNELTAFHS